MFFKTCLQFDLANLGIDGQLVADGSDGLITPAKLRKKSFTAEKRFFLSNDAIIFVYVASLLGTVRNRFYERV